MPLDVFLSPKRDAPGTQWERRLNFDNDGYYWFLHPLFDDIRKECGRYIDLYGDATFGPEELFRLEELLTRAYEMLPPGARRWNVHVGRQTRPEEKELFETVSRPTIEKLLSQFRGAVADAKARGWCVKFVGD